MFKRATPAWPQYAFSVAAAGLGLALQLWMARLLADPITPFLPALAAVIAAAAWGGFGPGAVASVLTTGWASFLLSSTGQHTLAAVLIRSAMFLVEGILLSLGSARMRQTTREILRSEEWHRRLLEISGEGIQVINGDGRIRYANARLAELLGTRVEEIEGRGFEEFCFEADLSVERMRFRNRRAGQREQFDRRLRRTDGSELWVLASANTFSERGGELCVLSMMTDITERKRAEQALRRSEERFRGLFENIPEGVYQSTPDGRILAANPMLLRMLGLRNAGELNDVNITNDLYVDPEVRRRLLQQLEREGGFQNVEYELRRRDGGVILVQENARVVRGDDGAVLCYEGTLTEVRQRRGGE